MSWTQLGRHQDRVGNADSEGREIGGGALYGGLSKDLFGQPRISGCRWDGFARSAGLECLRRRKRVIIVTLLRFTRYRHCKIPNHVEVAVYELQGNFVLRNRSLTPTVLGFCAGDARDRYGYLPPIAPAKSVARLETAVDIARSAIPRSSPIRTAQTPCAWTVL